MVVLFSLSLLMAAILTFMIQPMVARMVLPLFGGTASIWNICVLFFQATLLAGYAYAHYSGRYLRTERQILGHLGLMFVPLFFLPIWIDAGWVPPANIPPGYWLMVLLLAVVGVPFFVVSATAPLAQHWFGMSGHASARDPYFLYAASNLGSMVALISYPILLEPWLSLRVHSWIWVGIYFSLLLLLIPCGLWALGNKSKKEPEKLTSSKYPAFPTKCVTKPGWKKIFLWIALAFVPSSLMLSVTTYLTTDIAAMPLIWVTPLALYLLTFILAFSRKQIIPLATIQRIMPLVVIIITLLLLAKGLEPPIWLLLILHLSGLFVIALVCHGQLAASRPSIEHLTAFYLWISVGGVLGGVFNALVAPQIFISVAEYPTVLVLACLLRITFAKENDLPRSWENFIWRDGLPAAGLGLLAVALIFSAKEFGIPLGSEIIALMFGLPLIIAYTFLHRPMRFSLGIGSLFLAGLLYQGPHGQAIFAQRSFFGIHRVTIDPRGRFVRLVHGNTVHGLQSILPSEKLIPLTYYHPSGPIGRMFSSLKKDQIPVQEVAVVGLGVGSLAAYGQSGQNWTFYEIDPVVYQIASNPNLFTFWRDSRANLNVVLGDARIRLAEAESSCFDVLVIDAFNSDAVPLHLLTREALALYLGKIKEGGIIAFHISNRYLDLQPVLAELANDAGLKCYGWADLSLTEKQKEEGKLPSHWVVMGRPTFVLDLAIKNGGWQILRGGNPRYLWTDDFANVFSVFKWKEEE